MADGKIDYELSIDASRAVSAVRDTENALSDIEKSGDRAAAAADRAASAFGRISGEKIKTAATMIGMAALDISSSAMRVNGLSKESDYLQSAASGAMSIGMIGAMMAGPRGAAIGALIGGALGAGKQLFGNIEKDQREAERVNRLFQEIGANAEIAVNAVGSMKTPDELRAALENLDAQIFAIQTRASRGLIEGWAAREQIAGLERVKGAASAALEDAPLSRRDVPEYKGRVNALTAQGAILGAGSASSASDDSARSTATNTRRMVTLLERIERGSKSGGAVWQ